MKYINKILFALLLIAMASPAISQDYKQDMLKIRQSYTKYHFFKMKFTFCPYDSLSLVTDSMKAKCYMADNSYYYKVIGEGNEFEYIKNANHYLVIDHGNKVMAITLSSKARAEMWDVKKIDSLLATQAIKVSYKNVGANEGQYDIKYGKGIWNRLTLAFNKTTHTLDRLAMYSSEKGKMGKQPFSKPWVGISYTDYSENGTDNNLFSDSRYVYSSGNKTVPVEAYKGYKVLDYLNKN